jgi:fluoride exporter
MTVLLVALGAAIGAPLRYLAGRRYDRTWPLGTMAVNVAGSFLLGLCTAWSVRGDALAFLGVGFCGGLTTYSAFAAHTSDRLADRSTRWLGASYAAATVGLALAACIAGFAIGN